jgi:Phosphoesterase family
MPRGMAQTRRELLERTACAAGVAGMSAALPASTILAEAAEAVARASGLPAPRNLPIDHFVVLMMENRSFDHYFGWVTDADGSQQQAYTDPAGNSLPTRHFSTLGSGGMEYKGCGHPDPGHGVAFVDPPFRDGGGGDGLSADEHPLGDVRLGQAFMADVVNAFVSSPNYRRGALFVIYDEWAASSTTCCRRTCPTTERAPTCSRTSARWASASRRSRCPPSRGARAGARASGWNTGSTGTSRS